MGLVGFGLREAVVLEDLLRLLEGYPVILEVGSCFFVIPVTGGHPRHYVRARFGPQAYDREYRSGE